MSVWISVLSACVYGFSYVFDVITFIPFYIFDNPTKRLKNSRRLKAKPTKKDDHSSPYRSLEALDKLSCTPVEGCQTLDELFEYAVQTFSHHHSVGTRDLLHEEEEKQPNGKMFKKAIFGDYSWLTYAEVKERVLEVAQGLLELQSDPTVCIFAETQASWIISAFACFKISIPVTTLYSTLGEEAIKHGIIETDVNIIFTSLENVSKFKRIAQHLNKLKYLIYFDTKKPNVDGGFADNGITVLSFSELLTKGRKGRMSVKEITGRKPGPEDLAVIMYTSGSTGQPKGVMISHKNLCATISGFLPMCRDIGPGDTYVGYLPLAHIFELACELSCFVGGSQIGYSSPNTLSDQSTRIKKGSLGDVSVLRPTLVTLVPTIMDRLYKGVWEKINSGGKLGKFIFNFAFNYKKKWYLAGYSTPLIDRIVFSKLKNTLGGNVRTMMSGGAPLAEETQLFMNICFCCPIGQGYGLTEACAGGTIQHYEDFSCGRVGQPIGCCEIKLVNWEEGGYSTTDKPYPRGEVWIAGDCISMGYYKNPQKTAEDFKVVDGKRWFATGDIGLWEPDGCLRIIDRKKDLVKLQAGEYVSLGKVETTLCLSPYVDNICIWADSSKHYTVGFILPNKKNVLKLAGELQIQEKDFNKLVDDKTLDTAMTKHIQEFGLKGKLEKFEIPARVKLVKETWNADAGFLTESFKLKRKFIEKFYAKEISLMYAD